MGDKAAKEREDRGQWVIGSPINGEGRRFGEKRQSPTAENEVRTDKDIDCRTQPENQEALRVSHPRVASRFGDE